MLSRNWLARSLILVGDASYALYLVSPARGASRHTRPSGRHRAARLRALFLRCRSCTLHVSEERSLSISWMEKPTTRWLQRRISNSRQEKSVIR